MSDVQHLKQEMRHVAGRFVLVALLFEVLGLAIARATDFTNNETALLGVGILTACLPLGFAGALKIVHTRTGHRMPLANVTRAARCALADKAAELLLISAGAVALGLWHLLPALNFAQILAIDLCVQLLPLTALAWDKAHTGDHERQPESPYNHLLTRKTLLRFAAYGLLAAAVSYANYLWFFAQHNLSPQYIDPGVPLYQQASTLAFVTLAFCSWMYILFERADTHRNFFSEYITSNERLLGAFGAGLIILVAIVYLPPLQFVFKTESLGLLDWIAALFGACLYGLFRLAQRHTRRHTRHALIELHREVRR